MFQMMGNEVFLLFQSKGQLASAIFRFYLILMFRIELKCWFELSIDKLREFTTHEDKLGEENKISLV